MLQNESTGKRFVAACYLGREVQQSHSSRLDLLRIWSNEPFPKRRQGAAYQETVKFFLTISSKG